MTAIEKSLKLIRHKDRPNAVDYINHIFPDFVELCGDRLSGDDPSVVGGIASFLGRPVTVIGQVKGRTLEENIKYNFSMNRPEGYRKTLRLMKQAEKFHRPVICFVDTVGAYPGIEAEENGQHIAIANNLMLMMNLQVPIISVLIGDGGSGGALALCAANEIAALENAVLSVISPKACANILWKDSSRDIEAAQMLKMTANDLKSMRIIDEVILETNQGAHDNPFIVAENIRMYLEKCLNKYKNMPVKKLVELRNEKFRKIGEYATASEL
ncbi:acetyl-CoA carboxylase carboxyl transferase subunit alpha [Sporobacter termitidis DSM 10068]|uniref:acetyl-CoA carboxytransferase n=1 Tax=Sporobacter termitidis DSM 10068 TaxID=1123282 RepID=A0A1M5ZEE4_9FIRM|nr:acetyl-CoA carboxylase carboxyltransferase subunit alpha [Sporobacter termitidis]SHI22597.1 acetyl-CoA carboxylase carboxyl transferase subunit alpha [Sporobacter termitidis DSM 10068]